MNSIQFNLADISLSHRQFSWAWVKIIPILFLLSGCGRYIDTRYDTISIEPERLEQIEAFNWSNMSPSRPPLPPDESDTIVKIDSSAEELELDLDQCRALALQNNLSLQVQLYNPKIAKSAVTTARAVFEPLAFSSFSFYKSDSPTISDLEASSSQIEHYDVGLNIPLRTGGNIRVDMPFSRSETDNRIQIFEGETYSSRYTSYNSDLTFAFYQPLLRNAGFRANTHGIRVASYNAQASQARMKLETISTLALVEKVYWRLYAAREELLVRKQEYDLAVAQLEQAKRMVKAKTKAKIEILRAESAAAERLEGIILAENSVRDRERDLKRILNKPGLKMDSPVTLIPVVEPSPVFIPLDKNRVLDYALAHRMELLELELQIASQVSTVDFEKNRRLPALALSYSYNINGLGESGSEAFDLLLDNAFVDHRLGLNLEVPLGNKAAKSRLNQAVLRKRQYLMTHKQREAAIIQEVLATIDQLQANWQRVLASKKSALLAEETLNAEQRQYELGLQTSTELLSAQTRFANARSSELRARVEYQIAQIDMAYAAGCLLDAARVQWEEKKDDYLSE